MDTILSGLVKAVALITSLDPELYSIILLSLKVSGTAVVVAALLGIPLGTVCALNRFPGRGVVVTVLNTFMGLPPVVAGLVVYLFLSRSGPLGFMGLLYSPTAMVIAQSVIALPIVAALTWSAVSAVDPAIRETALTLGATPLSADLRAAAEARFQMTSAVIAGFGRTSAEVGAVLMVGGNISGSTRVMTTAIAMETGKGGFELAIALGVVLLLVAFLINLAMRLLQGRGRAS
ncbi:MAG: ABC transporter permease [Nitrospirae bacterium]|nr:ABC transporter permease [Nitrospirota bacterium]MBI5696328.1 ABC transporter permease [Nitrospirota bacterium]